MIKVSLFQGSEEYGPAAVPLFGPSDSYFEKTASATLLPEVADYIAHLKPRNDSQYVLVNAMGAGEYYGSNVNGDRFAEAALVHAPARWTGKPVHDMTVGKSWAYGYPTFYGAHVFPHHKNKDPNRALGTVELAAWNPHMKRVELVTRLEHKLCKGFGGEGIWDKLVAGEFPDVSMGTKVPFDTCSITLDRELYQKAWDTYNPSLHRSPGDAILQFHKKLKAKNGVGIRGLSITRVDYSEYARHMMNQILPDGRKVWVDNDFPKFFDISFVFMGADKIAKAMLKIAAGGKRVYSIGSAELADKLAEYDMIWIPEPAVTEKTAGVSSIEDRLLRMAERRGETLEQSGKSTAKSAMTKEVVPNQLAGKAVPLLTSQERDLPDKVLDELATAGFGPALSTATGLGIVLKPREFQRITLICLGNRAAADGLDALDQVFPLSSEREELPLGLGDFSPALSSILAPFMDSRSSLGPHIERRVVLVAGTTPSGGKKTASHSSELLRKIGAAYNGYREGLMQFVPHAQDLMEATSTQDGLRKLAALAAEELFTPLSYHYLSTAYLDEVTRG